MKLSSLVPNGAPFFSPGNQTGCMLVHGFSSMPEEMRWLGDYLSTEGYTVLGIRLAGHGSHPQDLERVRWHDWLADIEDGMAILSGKCSRIYLIGLSLGGMIVLAAAANYPLSGVIAMSTPYNSITRSRLTNIRIMRWLRPMVWKGPPNEDPALRERLEAEYPAYPKIPTRIMIEIANLQNEMQEAIPKITCPVLLIHSQQDLFVRAENTEDIYAQLADIDKCMIMVDDFDHAIVRDPKRDEVFKIIRKFIDRLDNSGGDHE